MFLSLLPEKRCAISRGLAEDSSAFAVAGLIHDMEIVAAVSKVKMCFMMVNMVVRKMELAFLIISAKIAV